MNTEQIYPKSTAVPMGVDGAVGVPEEKWFVAIVNPRHEKSVAEKLVNLGCSAYVATQSELHVWKNGRRKMVDRVVIPSVVFVKCTEATRREIVTLPFILRFMVNRSCRTESLGRSLAVIPEEQISRLKFMLGQSDEPVDFVPTAFHVNENVRVIRGYFNGLTGEIMKDSDGSHLLVVGLSILGGAVVHVKPQDVEKIQ